MSGTAATGSDGTILCPGDTYGQTRTALERALSASRELGAAPEHTIQTRLYFTLDADLGAGIRAHAELFEGVDPANTTVFVAGLPPEGALVEVELQAWVEE